MEYMGEWKMIDLEEEEEEEEEEEDGEGLGSLVSLWRSSGKVESRK